MEYRVGSHYGIHVYEGERPVATFHDPVEAARFVESVNGNEARLSRAWEDGWTNGWNDARHHQVKDEDQAECDQCHLNPYVVEGGGRPA